MRIFLVIALLLGGFLPAHAYYNPGVSAGFVNDFAGIIDDAQEQTLEQRLQAFEKETTNEIAVVTIPSLQGDGIERFSTELFSEWGIGKENEDNGILLLIAVDDREMRIEVGYGLEGALTDAQANWVINNELKPAFQNKDYSSGITKAVDTIVNATEGEYVPVVLNESDTEIERSDGEGIIEMIWIWGSVVVYLFVLLARSKSWWAGGVIGGIVGIAIGLMWGFISIGIGAITLFIPLGLLFDFFVSKQYQIAKKSGRRPPWWIGGGGFGGGGHGGFGGGFGGFGGGMSGGGGASGRW